MLTVIIPVYNVTEYLDECVHSLTKQSYRELEILLVDDGSTDASGSMCDVWAKKDERIRVIHKQNGGLSSARNAGLDEARGEYIAFVDSDDFIDKSMYCHLLSVLERDGNVDIACCGITQFKDEDYSVLTPFMGLYNRRFTVENYWQLVLQHRIDNAVCNKLYRKDVIGKTRFKQGVVNEDILFNLEVTQKTRHITYVPDAYYKYRLRAGSITRQAHPRLFDFIDNAFFLEKVLLEDMNCSLKAEAEAYIYHEMVNCIATVEKYQSVDKYRRQVNSCKRYILANPLKSFCNSNWPVKQKIKFFLVSYCPTLYRNMLKR